jgi:hypothetical protein
MPSSAAVQRRIAAAQQRNRQGFAPTRGNRFTAAGQAHLLSFLRSHRGDIVLVREAEGPHAGEYDKELNRHIRESAANPPFGASVARAVHVVGGSDSDDGGEAGVREPRWPMPGASPVSAAAGPDV